MRFWKISISEEEGEQALHPSWSQASYVAAEYQGAPSDYHLLVKITMQEERLSLSNLTTSKQQRIRPLLMIESLDP